MPVELSLRQVAELAARQGVADLALRQVAELAARQAVAELARQEVAESARLGHRRNTKWSRSDTLLTENVH